MMQEEKRSLGSNEDSGVGDQVALRLTQMFY